MNNLYDESDVEGILKRIEKLTSDAQRQWGKMNTGQMLAHCNKILETAMGRNVPKRMLIGRIIGPLVKPFVLNKRPMPKNLPTSKAYLVSDNHEFKKEKAKAIERVKTFYKNGPDGCTKQPNFFFGKLTPEEWAILQWKHWDHHLRQFGV